MSAMWMWWTALCAGVLSIARVTVADSSNDNSGSSDNLFIFPTAPGPSDNFVADLAWALGSMQKIQWTTTIDSYYIALFQQIINPASGIQLETIYTAENNGSGQYSFDWSVQTFNANRSASSVYFLWLLPGAPNGFTCHYFNITQPAHSSSSSSSSTAATSSSTSATNSVIASPTMTTQPQTSSTTSLPSPSSTNSSSETVKVGLGVGLGIGIPLVLIAGIWIGLKSVQQRKSVLHGSGSDMPLSDFPKLERSDEIYLPPKDFVKYTDQALEAPKQDRELHEAPTDREPRELG